MKLKKLNVYKLNSLDIEERLRKMGYKELYIRNHTIKYHYLITVILNKYFYFSRDYNRGYVKVYAELLSDEIAKGRDKDGENKRLIYVIREHLLKWGVIDYYNRDLTDSPAEKNSSDEVDFKTEVYYKINDEFYCKGYKLLPNNDSIEKLKLNIEKQYSKEKYREKRKNREQCLSGVYKHMKSAYMKIKLDKKSAQKCLNNALRVGSKLSSKRINGKVVKRQMNESTSSYYQMVLDKFETDKYFHVDYITGRVYSTLTNLPKMFRPFLSINGNKFTELDISNSQPLLLSLLYRKWCDNNSIEIQKDGDDYKVLCETGNFYFHFKDFVKRNNVKVEDTFKTDVFTRIFFNEEYSTQNSYQILFSKKFPSVAKCIKEIKKNGYKRVAHKLQRIESNLIINKISNRLIKEGIIDFFTIHDSIAVISKDVKRVNEIMLEEFTKVGLTPTIKEK